MEVIENSDYELNIKIQDKQKKNFQPQNEAPYLYDEKDVSSKLTENKKYKVKYTKQPFSFRITNPHDNNHRLFDSSVGELIFSDNYIKLSTVIEGTQIYGFNEREDDFELFFLRNYTTWNYEMFKHKSNREDINNLGNQAMIIFQDSKRVEHYIILFKSNSAIQMQILFQGKRQIDFHFIGGIIDMKMFIHHSYPKLLQLYRNYIGQHMIPPFWALGYHHGKEDYKNTKQIEKDIKLFQEHDIPVDSIWLSNEYMNNNVPFTFNKRFKPQKLKKLRWKYRKRIIAQIIPTFASDFMQDKNIEKKQQEKHKKQIIDGFMKKVFLMDRDLNNTFPLVTQLLNRPMYVPDFLHPNTSGYWHDNIKQFQKEFRFDGFSLEKNSMAAQTFAKHNMSQLHSHKEKGQDDIMASYHFYCKEENEKFTHSFYRDKCFNFKSIDIFSEHYGGVQELYHHNVFNLYQSYETYKSMKKLKHKLPFIVTQANSLNSHKYAAHYTGKNHANFNSLRKSIHNNYRQILNGIQMSGSIICGYEEKAFDQLCARWYQLGALYPFAINFNKKNEKDQHPVKLGKLSLVSAKKNLKLRYSLLRYYYMSLLKNKRKDNIWTPLYMAFKDTTTSSSDDLQQQFMIGDYLMATPLTYFNKMFKTIYITTGQHFFNFHSGHFYHPTSQRKHEHGFHENITCHYDDYVPLFLLNGKLVQVQNTRNVQSTFDLNNEISLKIGINEQLKSEGQIILLGNLLNETNVINYCIKKNCLAKVKVVLYNQESIHIRIQIKDYELFRELVQNDDIVKIVKLQLFHRHQGKVGHHFVCQEFNIIDKKYKQKIQKNNIKCIKTQINRLNKNYHTETKFQFDIKKQFQQIEDDMVQTN